MRAFYLQRDRDISGVSGTGIVAEGVQFSTGKCALTWRTEVRSVSVYDSLAELQQIHCHGGASRVVFSRFEPLSEDSEKMRVIRLRRPKGY